MRIFASKSFLFQAGEEETSIRNHEIKDMPDWIAATTLFKLAENDGSIQVIENSIQQKTVENGKDKKGKKKTDNESPLDSNEE